MTRRAVPLTVITGFLGAGKTTLLKHILTETHDARIAVLVNDFGDLNFDSELIRSHGFDTVELTNGCICCSIRADLVGAVLRVLRDEPDHIVIEASGLSDPLGIAETLFQPPLDRLVTIDGILCVVDAEAYPELDFHDGELALSQMVVSDIVIVNKTDLATQEALTELKTDLLTIVGKARLWETSHCRIPLGIVFDGQRMATVRPGSKGTAEIHLAKGYSAMSWHSDRPLDLASFEESVRSLPVTFYRGKGLVVVGEPGIRSGWFQLVGKRTSLDFSQGMTRWERSSLSFIGTFSEAEEADLRERLIGCVRPRPS